MRKKREPKLVLDTSSLHSNPGYYHTFAHFLTNMDTQDAHMHYTHVHADVLEVYTDVSRNTSSGVHQFCIKKELSQQPSLSHSV